MGTLSAFCDKSGDFGPFNRHYPYYILALVLHDQESPIIEQELELERILEERGLERAACHTHCPARQERALL